MARRCWILMLLACSCASTSRHQVPEERVPRATLRYSNGDTFELEHKDAFPRLFDPERPRDVDDGRLTGHVCGTSVQLDARWFAHTLTLTGYGRVEWPGFPHSDGLITLTLGVRETAPGHRIFSGQFDGHIFADAASPLVDLDVSADHLEGRIGNRELSLDAKGDYLVGHAHERGGTTADVPFAIYGRTVLSAMAPADEGFALLALIACDGLVDYGDDQIRGFALTRLPPRRKGAIAESDDDVADEEAPARTDVKRVIEPTDAATTVEALREYRNEPAIIYLPKRATDEMRALADSLGDIFRRAGFTVEQRSWRTSSCRRPEYDLALIGNQPATPAELAVGLRLTLTKLHTFVCQSANAEPDKLGVLVLPPHR